MLARDLRASLGQHPGMGLQGKSAGGAIPSVFPQWEQSWQHDWVIRWINNVFSTVPHTQWGFPGGSIVKNPPAVQEMWVQHLGWEDPLEEEVETQSSILA